MRMSDLVMLVMRVSPSVLDVEVRTSDDTLQTLPAGMVYIMVSTNLEGAELYDLRATIGQAVEPSRPMGVGYEIVMKRPGAGSIVGKTERGPAQEVRIFESPGEVMRAFGYDTKPQRTRFNALADELTAELAPLKKPSTSPDPFTAPRLFELIIEVKDRKVSPCPKCGCQAFTPGTVAGKPRLSCRGCPLPSPNYPVNNLDAWGAASQEYKCGSCGKGEPVTMLMGEINLYCRGCGKLTLHTKQVDKTRVLTGSKAIFKFDGVEVGFASGVEEITYEPLDAADVVVKDYVPGEYEGTISMTLVQTGESTWPDEISNEALAESMEQLKQNPPPTSDWVRAIEQMQTKVASAYGMTYEELTASPAAGLWEMFRVKLGLREWKEFAAMQRDENMFRRGLKERDWDRRTGRTTRALLFSIAEFVTSDLRMFCVVGDTERYTKDLVNMTRNLYAQLKLARDMPIRPIFPKDFDPQYDYSASSRAQVFVDHYYAEKALERRFGR